MKILTLLGSPRKKGNTSTVLSWVEEALAAEGHQIERVNLVSKDINGCLACKKCKENDKEPGCIQKDDGNEILEKMVSAEGVIYASPLFYWGFSAQMKALVDRRYCLFRGSCGAKDHRSFVEGQRHGLIMTAADPFENNFEEVMKAFQRMLVYDKAHSAGELFVCNCKTPDALGEEVKALAYSYANQFCRPAFEPYALLIPGGAHHFIPAGK